MGGVLAIDHGTKAVGFASADALRISRQPLEGLRHEGSEERLLEHLEGLVEERPVTTLVVGLPLQLEGRLGERARATLAFAHRLAERFAALEVLVHDERLTTKEAESRLREAGLRGRDAARRKDSWSALVLLEDWIECGEPRAPLPPL